MLQPRPALAAGAIFDLAIATLDLDRDLTVSIERDTQSVQEALPYNAGGGTVYRHGNPTCVSHPRIRGQSIHTTEKK